MTTDLAKKRDLAEDRDPWTKQPWESWPAFNAFAIYRDMGHTRTLRKAAGHVLETSAKPRKLESVVHQLADWSQRNRWQERVDAFVVWADQELVDKRLELQASVVRDDLASAGRLRAIADDTLDQIAELGVPVDPQVAARFIEVASRTSRLSAGLSTENMRGQLQITMQDLGRVVNAIVVGACENGFVPADRQEEFVRWVLEEASS